MRRGEAEVSDNLESALVVSVLRLVFEFVFAANKIPLRNGYASEIYELQYCANAAERTTPPLLQQYSRMLRKCCAVVLTTLRTLVHAVRVTTSRDRVSI